MKNIFYFLFFIMLNISAFSQSWQWASRFGGASPDPNSFNPDETIRGIATDSSGNVYVCGRIRSGADLDGTPITTYGGYDIFLAKYNSFGNIIWLKIAGSALDDEQGDAITLDKYGHIYLTGVFRSAPIQSCNFFGTIINQSNINTFVAKLDTSGNLIWVKRADLNASSGGWSNKIKIDLNDMINVLGRSSNETSLFSVYNFPGFDYIARFDTSGNINRLITISPNNTVVTKDYLITPSGDQYVTGQFSSDSAIIGTQTIYLTNTLTQPELFFAKFDSAGVFQWVYHLGETNGNIVGYGIDLDNNGDIFLAGSAHHGSIIGPDTVSNPTTNNATFVAKFNSNGQALWATNPLVQFGYYPTGGIKVLPNGNAVFSGTMNGNCVFGDSSFAGLNDIYISEVSTNGDIIWGTSLKTTGNYDAPECVNTDAYGNIYVGGGFDGTMTNPNSLTYQGGYTDGIIAKFNSGNVNLTTISAQPSDSVICENSGAMFSVSATGIGLTYRWQLSNNHGATWWNLLDTAYYTGTSTNMLSVSNAPFVLDSCKFRCLISGTLSAQLSSGVAMLRIHPAPMVNAFSDTIVCKGDSASLHGVSGGISQIWTPSAGLNDPTSLNPMAGTGVTTIYTFTVTDILGCTAKDIVQVTIQAPLANAGIDSVICEGDTIMLSGSGGISYSWLPTTGLDNPGIANPLLFADTTRIYIVTVTDASGCVNTDTVKVVVDSCVGIWVVLNDQQEISIFPNPTTGKFTIEVNNEMPRGTRHDSAMKMELYNLLGEKVFETELLSSVQIINTEGLQSGMYFVQVKTKNKTLSAKFVKN